MSRGVSSGVRRAQPDGTLFIPGGLVARIGSGAPGVTLNFPILGFMDDGQLTPVVFMDNGPTPLLEEKLDGGRYFPPIILTGLPAGTAVAFVVAKTPEAAARIASGGNLATDASGRVVVIGSEVDGQAALGPGLMVSGFDGTNAYRIGVGLAGFNSPANILIVGGRDGAGKLRALPVGVVDTAGPGNAIQIGFRDSTNVMRVPVLNGQNQLVAGAQAIALDSTTAPLGASATYTGLNVQTSDYSRLCGTVFANVAGTLNVDQSGDGGANFDGSDSVAVVANVGQHFNFQRRGNFARLRYVNGAGAQATFRLFLFGSTT